MKKLKNADVNSLNVENKELLKYNSGRLFDILIEVWNLKTDFSLSIILGISPSLISSIRHGKVVIGPTLLIRIHDKSNLSISELRQLLASPLSLENN